MSDSATPWIIAHWAPLSIEFSRQEYWSGEPFPSSGGLPNLGIELRSPTVQADSLSEPPGREGHKGMEEMVMNKGTEGREGTEK